MYRGVQCFLFNFERGSSCLATGYELEYSVDTHAYYDSVSAYEMNLKDL